MPVTDWQRLAAILRNGDPAAINRALAQLSEDLTQLATHAQSRRVRDRILIAAEDLDA